MDINLARQDINVFTNNLVRDTEAVINLMNSNNLDDKIIDEIFKNKEPDERDAILEVASTYNPVVAEKLGKLISKKISSWMDNFF